MDGTALHDERSVKTLHTMVLRDLRGYVIIEIPRRVFAAPCVELPINRCDLLLRVQHERRAVITEPRVVMLDFQEIHVRLRKHRFDLLCIGWVHDHSNGLKFSNCFREIRVALGNDCVIFWVHH
ncbi:hypothetical protein D3C85_1431670 [compost metagenome]